MSRQVKDPETAKAKWEEELECISNRLFEQLLPGENDDADGINHDSVDCTNHEDEGIDGGDQS